MKSEGHLIVMAVLNCNKNAFKWFRALRTTSHSADVMRKLTVLFNLYCVE
jgi:5'(3')-deoxyribonucleotidase